MSVPKKKHPIRKYKSLQHRWHSKEEKIRSDIAPQQFVFAQPKLDTLSLSVGNVSYLNSHFAKRHGSAACLTRSSPNLMAFRQSRSQPLYSTGAVLDEEEWSLPEFSTSADMLNSRLSQGIVTTHDNLNNKPPTGRSNQFSTKQVTSSPSYTSSSRKVRAVRQSDHYHHQRQQRQQNYYATDELTESSDVSDSSTATAFEVGNKRSKQQKNSTGSGRGSFQSETPPLTNKRIDSDTQHHDRTVSVKTVVKITDDSCLIQQDLDDTVNLNSLRACTVPQNGVLLLLFERTYTLPSPTQERPAYNKLRYVTASTRREYRLNPEIYMLSRTTVRQVGHKVYLEVPFRCPDGVLHDYAT